MEESGLKVNPLANPKGTKKLCHLCQHPAKIQCPHCRVTYYCGIEDQKHDWNGIHSQVCSLIALLRAPLPHANSEIERKHRRQQQQRNRDHIIEVALTEGRKQLHNGEPSLAFPPSLLALKLLTETHGSAHIQLTPALLLLAQSAIGQGQLREAEQYLSQAQWTVSQTPSTSSSLRSQLHRNLGLLATARGDFINARKYFAEDIYQSSVAHSPRSIQTVGGLFYLGNVFLKQSKPSVALSLHEQVVKIWMSHLEGIVKEMDKAIHTPLSSLSLPGVDNPLENISTLNVAERVEAKHHLHSVLSLKEFHSLSSSSLTFWVYYTLALLSIVTHDYKQALTYCHEALNHSSSTPETEHPNRDEIEHLINLLPDLQK